MTMKKIVLAKPINDLIGKDKGFLQRADVRCSVAATNNEIMGFCRTDRPDLIMSHLDMPGRSTIELFEVLRDGGLLQKTAVILVHEGRPGDAQLAQRCSARAVFRMPVDAAQLLTKAQQLLDIPLREAYRVLLSVKVEGKCDDKTFFCRTENISVTGLLLESERTFQMKDRVECSFFLPGSHQIVVHAEVVRQVDSPGRRGANFYGIHFTQISPEGRAAIEAFVEKKVGSSSAQ